MGTYRNQTMHLISWHYSYLVGSVSATNVERPHGYTATWNQKFWEQISYAHIILPSHHIQAASKLKFKNEMWKWCFWNGDTTWSAHHSDLSMDIYQHIAVGYKNVWWTLMDGLSGWMQLKVGSVYIRGILWQLSVFCWNKVLTKNEIIFLKAKIVSKHWWLLAKCWHKSAIHFAQRYWQLNNGEHGELIMS